MNPSAAVMLGLALVATLSSFVWAGPLHDEDNAPFWWLFNTVVAAVCLAAGLVQA